MEYFIHLSIMLCIYLILSQSFNIVFGLGGMFNLAHVAGYALGAYGTALLSTAPAQYGFFSCLTVSALVPALLAVLVGGISLRLSHDYFAIGTIAFSAVINAILVNFRSFTGGVLGIPGIPRPVIGSLSFDQIEWFFVLASVVCVIALSLMGALFRAPFGRLLRAQAESSVSLQALGHDARLIRNLAFVISAVFAGVAGSLFAYYLNFIDPTSFGLREMVLIFTICVVGRPGSFWGVCASTLFLVCVLPESLRFLEIDPSILGPMRQLLEALILFAVVWCWRERLFPQERVI